jgi:aromatic ring-cleaving dioxygenase
MTELKGYHAHVYYNADTRKIAKGLRDTIHQSVRCRAWSL